MLHAFQFSVLHSGHLVRVDVLRMTSRKNIQEVELVLFGRQICHWEARDGWGKGGK